ncbi:MAG: hypothetical protein CSA22_01425 [Deltaproteobacteria bacterium]|nr:MAG: hypothetical protein CSA22_01425 [Deltaproteobacteria bacterium]
MTVSIRIRPGLPDAWPVADGLRIFGTDTSVDIRQGICQRGESVGAAMNRLLASAQGDRVGILDPRFQRATPRVICFVNEALQAYPRAMVIVPSYLLPDDQHASVADYDLFTHATVPEGKYQRGWLAAMIDAPCFFFKPGGPFSEIRYDTRFTHPDGGLVFADFFKRMVEAADTVVVLPGEGVFARKSDWRVIPPRDRDRMRAEYRHITGTDYAPCQKTPVVYGPVPGTAMHLMKTAVSTAPLHRDGAVSEPLPDPRDRSPAGTGEGQPRVSVVVVVYQMKHQAMQTLQTLSPGWQTGADPDAYEVIVMENASSECLDPDAVRLIGPQFSYHRQENRDRTPISALNAGIGYARGELICLMVDGARMVSPGIIRLMLDAMRLHPDPFVAIPGYHLGFHEQNFSRRHAYDESTEAALLRAVDWKENRYHLFSVSCFSGGNYRGVFCPMFESNCIACRKETLKRAGGVDSRFKSPGGGMVNLDLFRRLILLPETRYFVTPGEGSFHQYHGGVTTSESRDNDALHAGFRREYEAIRGEAYRMVLKEPYYLGRVYAPAYPQVSASADAAARRYQNRTRRGEPEWVLS